MSRRLPFTEAAVRRAIAAARKEGIEVTAVSIAPDGTVTVFKQGLASPSHSGENHAKLKWLDVEA
jgi:uncharacterized protein GlcG (DUF336 family)